MYIYMLLGFRGLGFMYMIYTYVNCRPENRSANCHMVDMECSFFYGREIAILTQQLNCDLIWDISFPRLLNFHFLSFTCFPSFFSLWSVSNPIVPL